MQTINLKIQIPFVYFPDDEVYYRYLHVIENKYVKKHNPNQRKKKFTCPIRADKLWRKIYAQVISNQMNMTQQGFLVTLDTSMKQVIKD